MTKIAIWGYGRYGRRMFESLTQFLLMSMRSSVFMILLTGK